MENFSSKNYWENRYRNNETSGAGSYNRLAEFKATVLNDFIKEKEIHAVIEHGCGDGNQQNLLNCNHYIGFDVSETVINLCLERYKKSNREFYTVNQYKNQKADLAISLDVIYHLLEDDVYHEYLKKLFSSSEKYVVIYSSNTNKNSKKSSHVKHRKFTNDVPVEWKLQKIIKNKYSYDPNNKNNTSFADFYIYEKTMLSDRLLNHYKEIKKIIDTFNEKVEGNFICHTTTDNLIIDRNREKILNLQTLAKNKKNICEIGINAGHSLLLMLDINPDANYYLFDNNMHKYTEPCLNYIKTCYPNTKFFVRFGDSKETLPEFIKENQDKLNHFDLVHVDGGHGTKEIKADYKNSLLLSNTGSPIIFDDYNLPKIRRFIDSKLLTKEVIELKNYNKTPYHIVYEKKND